MFLIKNTTKKKVPEVPFEKIKDSILGKNYELSLVFCSDALSRRLNLLYRDKNRPANVLSFPLGKFSGEIFINLSKIREFSAAHLFIHALLHLKGMRHGRTMEQTEKRLLSKFSHLNKHGAANRSRH